MATGVRVRTDVVVGTSTTAVPFDATDEVNDATVVELLVADGLAVVLELKVNVTDEDVVPVVIVLELELELDGIGALHSRLLLHAVMQPGSTPRGFAEHAFTQMVQG